MCMSSILIRYMTVNCNVTCAAGLCLGIYTFFYLCSTACCHISSDVGAPRHTPSAKGMVSTLLPKACTMLPCVWEIVVVVE